MKVFSKRNGVTAAALCLVAAAILFISCGGGGSTGASGDAGSTAATARTSQAVVYLTDNFRDDYAHVWATVYHVDLIPQSGDSVTLFDSAAGLQIDLRTLRDSTGARFSFLGGTTVPQGAYTGVRVTIGATMQLFKTGATTGETLSVDSTVPTDSNGHPVLTFNFAIPKVLTDGPNPLVIDFDLAKFIIRGSKILPALQEGDGANCSDPNRHNPDDYQGTVSSLAGTTPDLTFTLERGNGQTIQVVTNASTAVNGDATLANGSRVIVTGTVDSTTGNLVADRLDVLPAAANPPPAELSGAASNLDATAGTFTVTLVRAHGFTPTQTTVQVATSSATTFVGDSGTTLSQVDFFTALQTTSGVMVEGSYDAAANTLAALKAKIIDQAAMPPQAEKGEHSFRPGVNAKNWAHGAVR